MVNDESQPDDDSAPGYAGAVIKPTALRGWSSPLAWAACTSR